MQKVLPLIRNLFMQSGNLPSLFLSIFRILLHAGEFALFSLQILLGLSIIPYFGILKKVLKCGFQMAKRLLKRYTVYFLQKTELFRFLSLRHFVRTFCISDR